MYLHCTWLAPQFVLFVNVDVVVEYPFAYITNDMNTTSLYTYVQCTSYVYTLSCTFFQLKPLFCSIYSHTHTHTRRHISNVCI